MTQYPQQVRSRVKQAMLEGMMNSISAMTGITDTNVLSKAAKIKAPEVERRLNTSLKTRSVTAHQKTASYVPEFFKPVLPA